MALAIIQGRMGSSRFPGKVLKEVLGKPLLQWQLERLKHAKSIEEIIVATTVNTKDDPIAKLCEKMDINVYRGSEKNVLERFYRAVNKTNFKDIFRLTGDCPLVDPEIVDMLEYFYKEKNLDYARTGESFCEGLDAEILNKKTLDDIYKSAVKDSHKEHVTLYAVQNPGKYKIGIMENSQDDSNYRITVDEIDDFKVVKEIMEHFAPNNKFVKSSEIVNFLKNNPDIYKTNSYITRNEGLKISLRKEK